MTVRNSVLHHLTIGFRYEDDLATLQVEGLTVGREVEQPFKSVASPNTIGLPRQ